MKELKWKSGRAHYDEETRELTAPAEWVEKIEKMAEMADTTVDIVIQFLVDEFIEDVERREAEIREANK